jgi:hypothetical protein
VTQPESGQYEREEHRECQKAIREHEPREREHNQPHTGAQQHHGRRRCAHPRFIVDSPAEIDRVRGRADTEQRAHRASAQAATGAHAELTGWKAVPWRKL